MGTVASRPSLFLFRSQPHRAHFSVTTTVPPTDIVPVTIEEEMRRSYLDYAMSVIVARALPDVRDGLKPVHRRILFGMSEAGFDWSKAYKKSARVVGEVMGKYHPHGDAAIYDAMVRMAQTFSMSLPLIDGQGNFGSMDGDPPAAMRYTEARLARTAEALLRDIDRDTVDFQPSYDDSGREPTVLPAEFPNLLVNGAGGIAVGMATNIPPHNLGEIVDATIALVDNPDITVEELMVLVPGPDFPTGGLILGRAGIIEAYRTGRGSIQMRGRAAIEEIRAEREAIVITEVPYQQNKARLIERIAEVVHEKLVDGISALRDESDRHGVRIVVELKRDAMADVVLNQLYKFTPLQTSFGINTLALNGGRPELMGLKDILEAFLRFREQVITRRTVFELNKARDRAHRSVGLAIAVANLDPVIQLVRAADDPAMARRGLMARAWPAADMAPYIALVDDPNYKLAEDGSYRLSERQADAILELRLHRLTGLEREKIAAELKEITEKIADYLAILGSRERVMTMLKDELKAVKDQFAGPRRTTIEDSSSDQDIEDLIQREDMVITVSHSGYIKRVPLSTYRAQRRGGRGRSGMQTRDEDFVSQIFVANTHTPVLFFTSRGMVFQLKVYKLPIGTPQSRGKAMVNILPLAAGEKISTVMPLPADPASWERMTVVFATSRGDVRRNALAEFTSIKVNGKIAMKLADDGGERLIGVQPARDDQNVLLATRLGKCIRFALDDVRVFASRNSTGVRGVKLADGDEVISLSLLRHVAGTVEERAAYLRHAALLRRGTDTPEPEADDGETAGAPQVSLSEMRLAELSAAEEFLLTVSENGFGKRSSAYEYRVTGRGGSGIANMEITDKTGPVVETFPVGPADQIMLVTDRGQLIRTPVDDIRIAGRKTQGVTLFRVETGERVVSVSHLPANGEEQGAEENGGEEGGDATPDGGEGGTA
ncbi:MAG: DNA gyrase subunit A [Alphaproteobacteria bacterium]|nr:DNA gyrase subunit A [Alphaproteobacteria bacterium]